MPAIEFIFEKQYKLKNQIMKTIFKTKLLILVAIIGLTISCKTSSAPGSTGNTDTNATRAGDSTSINNGTVKDSIR